MKNFDFIAAANESLKNVNKSLRSANKEYSSISRVLKDIQRVDMLRAGYGEVFAAVGVSEKIAPKDVFALVPANMWVTDKKGEKIVGLWGYKKGENGENVPVLRKVTAWTPNKLFKVLAQAKAMNSAK